MSINHHIRKSVKLRRSGCFWQAQDIYAIIVEKLTKEILSTTNEKLVRKNQGQIADYVIRLQHLEFEIDYNGFQSLGQVMETIDLPPNTVNFDLGHLLAKYSDERLKELIMFQREVTRQEDLDNFQKLAEIMQRHCPTLRYVKLKCYRDGEDAEMPTAVAQRNMLNDFQNKWPFENIKLSLETVANTFLDTHKIVFNNGHVFYIHNGIKQFTTEYMDGVEVGIPANRIVVWSTTVLDKYAERY